MYSKAVKICPFSRSSFWSWATLSATDSAEDSKDVDVENVCVEVAEDAKDPLVKKLVILCVPLAALASEPEVPNLQ